MLHAALLDVGGTLWPDQLTAADNAAPMLELGRLLPELDAAQALALLQDEARQDARSLVQDTHARLARALQRLGATVTDQDVLAVRRALCVPAVPGLQLFPGATELLEGLKDLGLRRVIVSNVQV